MLAATQVQAVTELGAEGKCQENAHGPSVCECVCVVFKSGYVVEVILFDLAVTA